MHKPLREGRCPRERAHRTGSRNGGGAAPGRSNVRPTAAHVSGIVFAV